MAEFDALMAPPSKVRRGEQTVGAADAPSHNEATQREALVALAFLTGTALVPQQAADDAQRQRAAAAIDALWALADAGIDPHRLVAIVSERGAAT